MKSVVKLSNVEMSYSKENKLFDNFNLEIFEKEFKIIFGVSGRGKTTLLNIIGMMIHPQKGEVEVLNQVNQKIGSRSLRKTLKNDIGFLIQSSDLILEKSLKYNLKLPLNNQKKNDQELINVLNSVGIKPDLNKKCFKFSGGEQKRIALAKLILKDPILIIADEPTSNLDETNAKMVYDILKKLNENGKTIIVVSHDKEILNYSKNVVEL